MPKQVSNEFNDVAELVRTAEQDFIAGQTQTSQFVTESLFDDINKIEAYLNSKHTTGDKDSLGRDKPVFNIVIAKKNITARATDLDRKNIKAKASKIKDSIAQYLYTIHLQKWMSDSHFGTFLNVWGDTLAAYNSAVCKFVEQDGQMKAQVIPWTRLIVDVVDFNSNPVIETLEMTPAQLKQKKGYDQEMVDKLLLTLSVRETVGKEKKDTKSNYIKLYEIHGEMPLSYLTGDEDDADEYVQQMHVISFVASKEEGGYDDFTLVSGREKKNPYILTWLVPSTDGSISLNGAVKNLFEAQWMKNHTMKAIKDQLDLASQLIFQTADPTFANKNALSSIQSGDIMIHKENMPLTQVQNDSHDITALVSFGQQWDALAQEITGASDLMEGKNMPAGTAYRQAAIIQQESHSNFEMMMENKGLHLETMFREYITPFILKKMNTTEEIVATLDAYGIDKIDKMYVSSEAAKRFNAKAVEAVINETELPSLDQETQGVKDEMSMLGGQRFLKPSEISSKTWKDIIGEFEGSVIYEITGENRDKEAVMATLSRVFSDLTVMQGRPMTPRQAFVFNSILSETNAVSTIELSQIDEPTMQPAQQVEQTANNQIQ